MMWSYKKIFIGCIVFLMVSTFYPLSSFAHKVMIFGWVEGDTVKTISKFSGGKKVQQSPVAVYNTKGDLLLEGNTNTDGEFSFKLPAEREVKVVLEASMGHKTSCLVELPHPEDKTSAGISETLERTPNPSDEKLVSSKEISDIIERVLDKKMSVVLRMIAEKEEKQSLSEIISGLGYILGLVGIALWVRNR